MTKKESYLVKSLKGFSKSTEILRLLLTSSRQVSELCNFVTFNRKIVFEIIAKLLKKFKNFAIEIKLDFQKFECNDAYLVLRELQVVK